MSTSRGSFDSYSLESIMRALALKKRHGELVIVSEGQSTTIVFSGGHIDSAEHTANSVTNRLRGFMLSYVGEIDTALTSKISETDALDELLSLALANGITEERFNNAKHEAQIRIIQELALQEEGLYRFEPKISRIDDDSRLKLYVGEILLDWCDIRESVAQTSEASTETLTERDFQSLDDSDLLVDNDNHSSDEGGLDIDDEPLLSPYKSLATPEGCPDYSTLDHDTNIANLSNEDSAAGAENHPNARQKRTLRDMILDINYTLLSREGVHKAHLYVSLVFLLVVPTILTIKLQLFFDALSMFTANR